ncbi:MAG: hypothetical protein NZ908_00145 [Candidatus Micrarchaeota archaeon]|nr:hypothetical protein [Candidatus Micrarchaeota archaeon]
MNSNIHTHSDSQILERLLRVDLSIRDEILDLINRYNNRVDDSKKVRTREKEGQVYVVIDDNFIDFLRATDIRQKYNIQSERGDIWVLKRRDEDRRQIGVEAIAEFDSGFNPGAEMFYEDPYLGRVGLGIGTGFSFHVNQLGIWFRNAQIGLGLGSIFLSSNGIGVNIPRFGSILDFLIAMAMNPLQEAFTKGSFEEGILHFLGVTDEVRERYAREGLLGGVIGWFEEIGRRILRVWDNLWESVDNLIRLFSGKPREWELGIEGGIIMFFRAINSMRKHNFHEAEHIMQGIMNSKDSPLWIRGLVKNLEHSYWKERTKPFSSPFTALDSLFHSNRIKELNERFENAERRIETEDFKKLDRDGKREYIINLFYVLFAQRDFNPSETIKNLPHILGYLIETGDISSIVFLAQMLSSSPHRFKIREWNEIHNEISKIYLSSRSISTDSVLADRVNDFIAAKLFEIGLRPELADRIVSDMFRKLSYSSEETKRNAVPIINNILDSLRSISIFDPRIGMLMYVPFLSLSKKYGFFEGSITDHISKLPRSFNPEFGVSEIAGRKNQVIFSGLVSRYTTEGMQVIDRLINNLRNYADNQSKELKNAITTDIEYLAVNGWIIHMYRYLGDPRVSRVDEDTLGILGYIAGFRQSYPNIKDERLRRGFNLYMDEILRERTTTPLNNSAQQNQTQPSTQPQATQSRLQESTSKVLTSFQSSNLVEVLRKAREVAIGKKPKPNDEKFAEFYKYVNDNYNREDEQGSFNRIFGDKNSKWLYDLYMSLRRMYPNLNPILYITMILYELNRINQNNDKTP